MRAFKYTLFILFVLFPLTTYCSTGNWLNQQSTVTSKLTKCIFTDSIRGWAAGDSGVILYTSNGGTNWIQQNTGTGKYVFDMFFLDSETGWCIVNDINIYSTAELLKTTNSGENWIHIYAADSNLSLFSVYFRDSVNGWLAGYGGVMLHTTNGGFQWNIVPPDSTVFGGNSIWNISFSNTGFGYACGGFNDIAGVIWKSDPGGLIWTSQGVSPEPIYKIVYDDNLNGFGVGGDFEYGLATVKTTDGGISWMAVNTEIYGIGRTFSRRVYNEIWVPLSISPAWAVTTNNGNSWIEIPSDNNSILNDVFFNDSTHGWAVGDNGVIQKYNTSVIGLPGHQGHIISEFKLKQNFPNPFNNSTIIEFTLPEFSRVKLIVYDAAGRELKVILNDFRFPGLNRIMFNPDGFASGIYFYKLTGKDFTQTKKMVIVK